MRYEIETKSKIKSMYVTSKCVFMYVVHDNWWRLRCLNASSQHWVSRNILSREDLNRFTLKTVATTPAGKSQNSLDSAFWAFPIGKIGTRLEGRNWTPSHETLVPHSWKIEWEHLFFLCFSVILIKTNLTEISVFCDLCLTLLLWTGQEKRWRK